VWLFKSGKKSFHPFSVLLEYNPKMCSSRKYPYPPHRRSMETLRGVRISKAKNLKKTVKLNQRGF